MPDYFGLYGYIYIGHWSYIYIITCLCLVIYTKLDLLGQFYIKKVVS